MHLQLFVLAAAVLVAPRIAIADDLTVTVTPAQPRIEITKAGQSLSFDLILKSSSPATLTLDEIRVKAFDAAGALLHDKLARAGLAAGSQAETTIAPKGTLQLFNPFDLFDKALPIAKLHYALTFHDDTKAEAAHVVVVDVTPKPFTPKAQLVLPVRGRVIVQEGHDRLAHHRRVDLTNPVVGKLGVTTNPTRYGYDFCGVDAAGAMIKTDGKTNADWFGFGASIVSPGAGIVKELRTDVPDNTLGGKMFDFKLVFADIKAFYGNYVVIDHGNGEYSLLAHLKAGSVKVKVGDRVKAGQELAAMGISGDADRPHLHYQLQDGAQLNNEALPSYFKVRWWRGKTSSVLTTAPDSGDIVEAAR